MATEVISAQGGVLVPMALGLALARAWDLPDEAPDSVAADAQRIAAGIVDRTVQVPGPRHVLRETLSVVVIVGLLVFAGLGESVVAVVFAASGWLLFASDWLFPEPLLAELTRTGLDARGRGWRKHHAWHDLKAVFPYHLDGCPKWLLVFRTGSVVLCKGASEVDSVLGQMSEALERQAVPGDGEAQGLPLKAGPQA